MMNHVGQGVRRHARRHFSSASSLQNKTYDYIVVGTGSAGSVLANRLSASGKHSVLVLEAGGKNWHPMIHVPIGYLYTMNNKWTDWCYHTTEQPGLNGRSIPYPRGKTLGGCTSINGMIYQRGAQTDYDSWVSDFGCEGWGWESMLPYFEKSLNYSVDDGNSSSNSGKEWRVTKQRLSWELLDRFQNACADSNIPHVNPLFSSDAEGCGYFEVNQSGGFRWSTYRGFLKPVLDSRKANLSLVTKAHVHRLVFASDRSTNNSLKVSGVEVSIGNNPSTDDGVVVKANKDVILSAGAIGSPHILQCSGIGPKEILEKHGVEVLLDHPNIGANLHDHLQIRTVFKLASHAVTMNQKANSWAGNIKMAMEYLLFRTGPLSMAPSQFGLFTHSGVPSATNTPDLEYHVQPLSLDKFGDPLHNFPGLTLSVCNLRPTSRGTVELTSPNSYDAPAINPNYLHTDHDQMVAANAIKKTRDIVANSKHFLNHYQPIEILPGTQFQSDEELKIQAGNISTSIFHPVGTCAMGGEGEKSAVVCSNTLRVRGIEGVRVVDGSIMPRITSGNTSSPIIAMAEKASDIILDGS